MSRLACLIAGAVVVLGGSFATADVVVPGRRTAGRVSLPVVVRRGAIRGENNNVQAKVIIPRYLLDGALDTYREMNSPWRDNRRWLLRYDMRASRHRTPNACRHRPKARGSPWHSG